MVLYSSGWFGCVTLPISTVLYHFNQINEPEFLISSHYTQTTHFLCSMNLVRSHANTKLYVTRETQIVTKARGVWSSVRYLSRGGQARRVLTNFLRQWRTEKLPPIQQQIC